MMLALTMEWIVWPIVCGASFMLSSVFSGLETGVYLTNKARIELHADAGSRRACILRRFFRDMDHLLVVILIGNNISNYLATFAVSVMFVMAGYSRNPEWMTIAVAAPTLFVFSEAVPKNVFQRNAERLVHIFTAPLLLADWLFRLTGISYLVRAVSRGLLRLAGRQHTSTGHFGHEGLAAVLAEGQAAGALTADQRKMSERVMKLADVRVADVMQPMADVTSVPADISREAFLDRVREHNYSRLPMLDADGRVLGVLDIYDVLTDEKGQPVRVHRSEPMIIPADATVTKAIYMLQHACHSFAVVADSEGKHVGIVTIKDLVEEIVGELEAW